MKKIQDVGRFLVAGFNGTELNDNIRQVITDLGVGAVILFKRNYESPEQVLELTRKIRELAGRRIFIGVDQEGGRVARLTAPFTKWPPMGALGKTGDGALAHAFGAALGAELSAVGIDWDFAPVLDVLSDPGNEVIGDRSFGEDSCVVSDLGAEVIKGLQGAGVMACAKHFPGHGDTKVDSHKSMPMVLADEQALGCRDFPPFESALASGVASVMTAHVVYPVYDLAHPATTSRAILEGQLRVGYRYEGIVVTDDLLMGAIAERYELADAALMAFNAGADYLMCCDGFESQELIVRALYEALCAGLHTDNFLSQKIEHIENAQARFPVPASGDLSVIGCEAHQEIARRMQG